MKIQVIGLQNVDFVNKNGQAIRGINIFGAFEDENTEGLRTEKFFLSDTNNVSIPEDTKINDILEITFDYRKRIETIHKE